MSSLNVGENSPKFKVRVLDGSNDLVMNESDLLGKWSVVYFYPRDMTPGCTVEACSFRDNFAYFNENKVEVFGVSNDSVKNHTTFAQKHSLQFKLISDEGKLMVHGFDVYKEKSMFGKKYMGIERTTFLINPEGKIAFKWEKVNPVGHVEEVKAKLKELI